MARATTAPTRTFAELISAMPFTTRQANATGILPPILRSMAHLLYLAAALSDEATPVETAEAEAELDHAQEHWNATTVTDVVSSATNQAIANFGLAIAAARTEYTGWATREVQSRNIRDLANRAIGLTVILDRELLGLRDSEAGSSL